jgi:hypothetical protein
MFTGSKIVQIYKIYKKGAAGSKTDGDASREDIGTPCCHQ